MSDGNVYLEIEEIDKFQFVDYPITITANLVDTATNQRKLGETSNVKVLLAFEGNASVEHRCREHHPNLLEVIRNTGIQEDGTAKIEFKIKDVSMNHENQKFVIYLEAYRPHGENNIICAISNPITCVRHRLVLSEAYNSPYIWYKDEGAKDKCIRILVKLIDSNKNLVKDRNIVLLPTLIYSSGLPVQPANVLNLFHDRDKPFMIGHNGTEVIRFRVNEVSRNHRKQLFHLFIAPDLTTNASAADISPAVSLAFEVKSKRTSDAKKELVSSKNDDDSSVELPSALASKSFEEGNGKINSSSSAILPITQKSVDVDFKSHHNSTISPRNSTTEQSHQKSSGSKRSVSSLYQDSNNVNNNVVPSTSTIDTDSSNFESSRNQHLPNALLVSRESSSEANKNPASSLGKLFQTVTLVFINI